ncbi:hypothetical protein K493DRAFT_314575 [Basidiobolus meristosporus CBS 931.73]|uniref:Mediator of RNA polymerase II transcription subunit 17 n=1 Tax=Basidiobolus meristosporus CBS 931.73 TaxID=1314790 RepID=A0A1Y1YEF4_9FUNG|nr:hypothetical protein K493DRAFT_314575 [Basidiobolus meristosporus CBS 931.73]|eukprot:ORX96335.1 hypothetical protein K493DRAFT_314575 [Basidiobolus meristosporus CBS 931.73]
MGENEVEESAAKRLKLSVERLEDPVPLDITERGEHIPQPENSLQERLTQQIHRVWEERRDFAQLDEEDLVNGKNEEDSPKEESTELNEQRGDKNVAPGQNFWEMRNALHSRLWHAQSEIAVALDVVHVLLSATRPAASLTPNPLPLQPNTLSYTYINKPRPTVRTQLENAKLHMGAKQKQLKNASSILLRGATTLENVLKEEHKFWDEALSLRQRNWIIQTQGNSKMGTAGKTFYIKYGFDDAGSQFHEPGVAEIVRDFSTGDITNTRTKIALPHKVKRDLRVRFVNKAVNGSHEGDGDDIWSITPTLTPDTEDALSDIYNELTLAQSTIFDSELYQQISKEARTILTGVRMMENEISVSVSDSHSLIFNWSPLEKQAPPEEAKRQEEVCSRERTLSQILKLIMQLQLRKKHRNNLASKGSAFSRRSLSATEDRSTSAPPQEHILTEILKILRYYCFCEEIRRIVDSSVKMISKLGITTKVHFSALTDGFNQKGRFSFVDSLVLTVRDEHVFHFTLRAPTSIQAHLQRGNFSLGSLGEFKSLLNRELTGVCLQIICQMGGTFGFIERNNWELDLMETKASCNYIDEAGGLHPMIVSITRKQSGGEEQLQCNFNFTDLRLASFHLSSSEASISFESRLRTLFNQNRVS